MSTDNLTIPSHANNSEERNEVWRLIPGYDGVYAVSNLGRLQSIHLPFGSYMKMRICSKYGHLRVKLRKNKKNKYHNVHQLVLLAFVGPCSPGNEVRHKDGVAWNNNLDNLAYGTRKENAHDRVVYGRPGNGIANGRAKLTEQKVLEIREMRKNGRNQYVIASLFGIGQAQVSRIDRRVQWGHV